MLADIVIHSISILRDAFRTITFWEFLPKDVTNPPDSSRPFRSFQLLPSSLSSTHSFLVLLIHN